MSRISLRVGIAAAALAGGMHPLRAQVDTYGTTPVSYLAVGSNAFIPANNTITY
jgi:hypothetical protein